MGDLTNTRPMDDIKNMTYNSAQVIDMSFTNISIAENSTYTYSSELDTYEITELVVYLLVLLILMVFGIVGNILSIVVLGRDDVMKKTTRFLLRHLAMADMGFLIMFLFPRTCHTIVYKEPQYYLHRFGLAYGSMTQYLYFITQVFHVASIYSVVIVTGDRYIAICRPLQSGRLSTTRTARWAVVVVWCMAVIVNIPVGIDGMIMIPCNDATSYCGSRSSIPLYFDTVYHTVYHIVLVNIVKIIIPLTVLIIVNVKLIKAVRASRELHSETQRQQNNTTVMLVTIVITFSICFTPYLLDVVLLVIYHFNIDMRTFARIMHSLMYRIIDIFLAVNSAANFLIYLARGERFRRILKNICLPTRLQ